MDQIAFGRFVRRAVDDAKNRRGWTVARLSAETGIGRSTLFRWLAGDCPQGPELESLRNFCAALDIPVAAVFAALAASPAASPAAAVPTDPIANLDPVVRADIERIVQRLADPATPEPERIMICDMLRYLSRPQARVG